MTPDAVLLDAGGIFHLPDHDIVLDALERVGVAVDPELLDRAHYAGAACFPPDYEGELPWREMWERYLAAYVAELEVPDDLRAEATEHLESEFATAAIWRRVIPGSPDGLRTLADTGVRLGVVSNADGDVGARLRDQEVLQLGPGPGVEMETIIDSGQVGVMKPDPRIFEMALLALELPPERVWYVGDMPGIDVAGARRAGIEPFLMDPYGFNSHLDCERVVSLQDLASRVSGRVPG
ncbi:MAG: HAD hydrolase-like protein [Acidimicrobiia bacterium]